MRLDSQAKHGALASAAAVLVLIGGPGADLAAAASPAAGDADVLAQDFSFQPPVVTIPAGGSVTWAIGTDPEQHTVTPQDAGVFEDSGQLFPGDSFTVVFGLPGSVAYYCRLHPTMTGTVEVVAAASPLPTATNTSTSSPDGSRPAPTAAVTLPSDAVAPPSDAAGGDFTPVIVAIVSLAVAGVLRLLIRRRVG